MCSKKDRNIFRTVAFRLTLWYAALFAALSLVGFALVYFRLTSSIRERTDGVLRSKAREFASLYRSGGLQALRGEFGREARSAGIDRVFFRLLSAGRDVLAASDLSAWNGLGSEQPAVAGLPSDEETFKTIRLARRRSKVRVIYRKTHDGNVLQVGHTLKDDEELMERCRDIFGTAILAMLACGGGVGWFVARRAMRGVERVAQTATRIGEADFSHRVPLGNEGQEIENLATAFNEMLGRIEALVAELREVTNNIAHDLRSPITGIRGIAETTLTGGQGVDDYREMAGMVIEESDRLVGMIDTMLEIAQVDSGVADLSRTRVDLVEIARSAYELFQPVAEDKGVRFHMDAPRGPLFVVGDRPRLQRVVANLLDNAIKFTPADGEVELAAKATAARASVSVSDSGVGIGEKDMPHVFERFYRGDGSRSTLGNGLGLSLVQAVVRACGGEVSVQSSPGNGSAFTILLPRTSPSS